MLSLFPLTTRSMLRMLAVALLVCGLAGAVLTQSASADVAHGALAAPASNAGGGLIPIGKCKPPPLPTEGCIKNPCNGKLICCTRTSGSTNCNTMEPKKK